MGADHPGLRMNSRERLEADLDRTVNRAAAVNYLAWGVALFVMAYGTPIVYRLATAHSIPAGVAWMLSLASDGALCVGLIATPILAALQVPAGWVGALRWVAGFITWALQTADPWTRRGGVDLVGVGVHTAGPALLFFAVEAASYFHRKVAAKIDEMRFNLQRAEQADADRRAHLAELEADLRASKAEILALTSERDQHLQRIENLTTEAASTDEATTSRITALEASLRQSQADKTAIRDDYENRLQAASNTHTEELQRLRRELRQARAEADTINLDARRQGRTGGTSKPSVKTTSRPRMTDEEAVQRLLEAPADPAKGLPPGDLREWKQQDIVNELGVGWSRAPRLVEAVAEAQERLRSEASPDVLAVNQ